MLLIRNTIYIIFLSIFSYLCIFLVEKLYSYKVGDFDGHIYKTIFAPFLGFIISILVIAIYKYKNKIVNIKTGVVSLLLIFAIHNLFFNMNIIGGYYVQDKGFEVEVKEISLPELKKYLYSRNDEIAYTATEEFINRGHKEPSILLEELSSLKEKYGKTYADMYQVWDYVEVLAEQKSTSVKPYLYDMLKSNRSNKITYKGEVTYFYPARKYAKKYLSKYYNEEHNEVVVEEIEK